VGTDNNNYRCIYPHTSAAGTMPISGANWRMVWEAGGVGLSTWAVGTAYTPVEAIRLVVRRPIFDFDAADNTPDIPPQLQRALLFRLCDDLADAYATPGEDRQRMAAKYKGAYTDVFGSLKKKTNNLHNHTEYF
jgi:hypothetical protein